MMKHVETQTKLRSPYDG